MVTAVVPLEELKEIVLNKANKILAKGPLAVQMAKLVVNRGFDVDMDTGLLIENLAQAVLYGTDDKQEGTQAFLEKRKASFSGR
ncbi:enoyl-CoA hydratase-related protein [Bacillus sp. JCM 19041]|uniref:enoyl-CoA hydratase-related protein n=1 Tax=Bacillus sp. JCM 19041 TaxID=1460637 RepID=UPI000AA5440F